MGVSLLSPFPGFQIGLLDQIDDETSNMILREPVAKVNGHQHASSPFVATPSHGRRPSVYVDEACRHAVNIELVTNI